MRFYWFFLATLTVWRITHLLNKEDGPWNLFFCLRKRVGDGFWGQLLDCFLCLSVWIAAPLAWLIGESCKERLLLWPALSAAAILLERLTQREQGEPPAVYFKEDDDEDDLATKGHEGTRREKG
jgi:hypothetical protein